MMRFFLAKLSKYRAGKDIFFKQALHTADSVYYVQQVR
jgi:hypothetical protein